jgi:DNA-binding beta-propeller fold protein YncE
MTDGPSGSAKFFRPRGLAIAADGTIYVADTGNNRIRAISGGIVRTVAGGGLGFADGSSPQFAQPMGIALTGWGTLLVADAWNQRVREVRPDGTVTTWAGTGAKGFQDGSGASATFTFPVGVAMMPGGGALVVEPESGMLRAVSAGATHEVTRLFGSLGAMGWQDGPLGTATLAETIAVAARPGGEIVLLDGATGRVRAVRNGAVDTLSTAFDFPRALAVAPDGSVLVVDAAAHALRRIVIP